MIPTTSDLFCKALMSKTRNDFIGVPCETGSEIAESLKCDFWTEV